MNRNLLVLAMLLVTCLSALPQTAVAVSVLLPYVTEPPWINVAAEGQFLSGTTVDASSSATSGVVLAYRPGTGGGPTQAMAFSPVLTPYSGAAKDQVVGNIMCLLLYGDSAATDDQILLSYGATASALLAQNASSEPESAREELTAAITNIHVGTSEIVPRDTPVGEITLPLLPALTYPLYETVSGEFVHIPDTSNPSLNVSTPLPTSGSPVSVSLLAGHDYEMHFSYVLNAPNGIDPATNYMYSPQLKLTGPLPTPEPHTLTMLTMAGLLFGSTRRRRRA
jgi:hypothetical protein